ncbi:fibroblast growth factor-binding protein 1 [Pungitius pungitius]|uniref:fibroblast growth factor-binding protein 1 n=1 Tax=Pungitius pungitius TaxID=134920 RepID=UPI001888A295
MVLISNVTALLVLACISHQLMSCSCQKSHARRGRGMDRGQPKVKLGRGMDRGQAKVKLVRARSGPKAGRQSTAVSAQPFRGKMVTRDKSECAWAATGEDTVVLSVSCTKGDRSFGCEYVARPAACPRYAANVELFWKQIARALGKQRSACRGAGARVTAGVCRRAPADAHFRLRKAPERPVPPPVPSPAPKGAKSCMPGNRKLAEEHCNASWSSFCTFFFTMVQDYDC